MKPEPDEIVDSVFTPDVLGALDQAAAEARAGQSYSRAQVDEFLGNHRRAWLEKHAS